MGQDKMHLINKIFNNETIRTVWDKDDEKYYISVIDIVGIIAEFLEEIVGKDNVNIENKAKLITFNYKGEDYKLDLVQKRKSKVEK